MKKKEKYPQKPQRNYLRMFITMLESELSQVEAIVKNSLPTLNKTDCQHSNHGEFMNSTLVCFVILQ